MNRLIAIFESAEFSDAPAESFRAAPEPRIKYVICFTPRSGSSWLTEMLTGTKQLGRPEEWFNLDNLPRILRSFPRCDVAGYADLLQRRCGTPNGVFGLEMSFFQLTLLEEVAPIDALFGDGLRYAYLRREDFVRQAVSLYRATATGYFHSVQPMTEDMARKLSGLPYDADAIRHWAEHILQQEYGFERMFAARGIAPLRLTYEALAADPSARLRAIAELAGIDGELPRDIATRRTPLADATSEDWAARFRAEQADFVKEWNEQRGRKAA